MVPNFLFAVVFAYAVGHVSFGLILSKFFGCRDLQSSGSCSLGATNVLRVYGKYAGALVLVMDTAKGWLACEILGQCHFSALQMVCIGLSVVAGHVFPIGLKFKGGKGVATSAGVILALSPYYVFVAGVVVWAIFYSIWRYVSLASLMAAVACFVASFFNVSQVAVTLHGMLLLIIFYAHRQNICRLLRGTESKTSLS